MNDSSMNFNGHFTAVSPEITISRKKNKVQPEQEREQLPFEDILDRDDIEDATVLDNNTTIPAVARGNRGGIKIGTLTN